MNYYNPYFYSIPMNIATATPKVGLLTRIFGRSGASISGFLNGTQRVLNFANQAIPLVKQVRPMIGNAKTMFKVMNEFKRNEKTSNQQNKNDNTNNTINKTISNIEKPTITTENGPTFFM